MVNKKLMAVVVLLSVMCAAPLWGAQFRKVSDQQFIDMCQEGNTQGVIEAIKSGANVNAKDNGDYTALMRAAWNGNTETVNALIKAGADVNAKDKLGMTALIWAALNIHTENIHTEIVNALIQAGANVNAKDEIGCTTLMREAGGGYTETVNALIKAGADVNAKTIFGETALMQAARYGHTETVNALINAGADDSTDNEGKTALIHATEYDEYDVFHHDNSETVNALIDAGSYVKHKDRHGKTALDYARENPSLRDTDALKRLEELSR